MKNASILAELAPKLASEFPTDKEPKIFEDSDDLNTAEFVDLLDDNDLTIEIVNSKFKKAKSWDTEFFVLL